MSDEIKKAEKLLPQYRPATDIVELADGFHICLDMPGVAKDALTIDLNENELTVIGRTAYPADPREVAGREFHHVEFGGGEYRRTFTLADSVDREGIVAKLENGVLNLSLPKSDKAKPRRIDITAG